jgi:superfamily II DNA/RNA helicase
MSPCSLDRKSARRVLPKRNVSPHLIIIAGVFRKDAPPPQSDATARQSISCTCWRGRCRTNLRAALVDHFRDEASILIATEAAAEGVNLQFCNLVVNYDLPWNPQRIEQRIGRCHRYGQKFDVVVVNFLNKSNAADQRVYQLLDEKFRLFEGVFGASDEVLGAVESGVDFEKRIAAIYQKCRSPKQIEFEFDELQKELETEIMRRSPF